jgi:hypothetical protein
MADVTFSHVAGRTVGSELITRETVIGETPAWRATSATVGPRVPDLGLRVRIVMFSL